MADAGGPQYQKLPPGWDCKYDQATGNCYYINYLTKAMQLEDPRIRYKQLQNERCSSESISMQTMNSSLYHVYPSNNLPAIRAFQAAGANANSSWNNMSCSPLLSSRGHSPRLTNMSRRSTIQETSFSNQIDTDAVVMKIQNMFPTASENHIRLLLKKYYNREAVVISALQVEKHPVTMPGPFVTPPAQRHLFHSNSAFHMTPPARRLDIGIGIGGLNSHAASAIGSCGGFGIAGISRTASPIPLGRFGGVMSMQSGKSSEGGAVAGAGVVTGLPSWHASPRFVGYSSPKPHSSPKMKLRYMKNIFPKADEMLLLDILTSADNNVQKASEKLISMGYTKRDFMSAAAKANKLPNEAVDAASSKADNEKIIPLRPKDYTLEEKEEMKQRLYENWPQIPERIILMALESVNYSEDRVMQILQIVQEEDELRAKKQQLARALQATTEQGAELLAGTLNVTSETADKYSQRDSVEDDETEQQQEKPEFTSMLGRIKRQGHNKKLTKGPDERLLLADYITWNGANPNMSMMHKQLAMGADPINLNERAYQALGHNTELCKGAKPELAKGSIYAQLSAGTAKSNNIKCN